MQINLIKQKISNLDHRSFQMYKNTIAMMVIRGFSVLLSLISAPIMLHYVNRADYGVLLTLTSIVSWVGMMDIGLGNGLRNKVSEYFAKGQLYKARECVSSCYAALFIYVIFLLVVFFIISPHIDWLQFLNSPSSNSLEISKLANVVFISFCFQFFFSLINSILFAYQQPAYQSLLVFLGQLIAFIALIIQVFLFKVTSVYQIGAINCIIPPLVLCIGSIFLFLTRLREISPTFSMVNLKSVSGILSLGLKFFILQIITIVLFQANSILIAKLVSPESVVEYNLAFKYISLLTIIFNIIITPIWSATTDAYVNKDFDWIKRTLRRTRAICLLLIIAGFIMFFLSGVVYNIWLGKNSIHISYMTTFLILLTTIFEMLYKVYGTIINGTGKVLAQMIITAIIAILYIPLAICLGKKIGLFGILLSNVIVFALNYSWSKIQCLKLINQTANGIWNR